MTPQDMADYKMRWKMAGGHRVLSHSDWHIEHKDWCRRNVERQSWSFEIYTGAYEHTFWFELEKDAEAFKSAFKRSVYPIDLTAGS